MSLHVCKYNILDKRKRPKAKCTLELPQTCQQKNAKGGTNACKPSTVFSPWTFIHLVDQSTCH